MFLVVSYIADPPVLVVNAIGSLVAPVYLFLADLFAQFDGFEHGTVAVAAAPDIVDLASVRDANELRKCFDQIEAVNVVPHLFSFVAENPVRSAADGTDHQVREKTVQLGAGVRWPGETAATKRDGRHSEIAAVLLYKNVRCHFRCTEERMFRAIDTQRLRNTRRLF